MQRHDPLKTKFRLSASEYARRTGEIIGYEVAFWIDRNRCLDRCCFGGDYSFDLGEMQQIVDYLPEWVDLYGSKENVGKVICDWYDKTTEYIAINGSRSHINLWSWLKGQRYKDFPNG